MRGMTSWFHLWARAAALTVAWALPSPVAAGTPVDKASAAEKEAAQQQFAKGLAAYEKGDCASALVAFQASHDIVESPNSRLLIAECLARTDQPARAYREYEAASREAERLAPEQPEYEKTRTSALQSQRDLLPRVARVRVVTAPPGGTLTVAGSRVDDPNAPLVLEPRHTAFSYQLADGTKVEREVELAPGQEQTVELAIEQEQPVEAEPAITRPGAHPKYRVEVDAHLTIAAFDPPGDARSGFGFGARVTVPLLDPGPISTLNNSLGVGAGIEYIALTSGRHAFFPVVASWSFWFQENFAVFAEPGFGVVVRGGTFVRPAVYGGARYLISDSVGVLVRLGVPNSTVGATVLF